MYVCLEVALRGVPMDRGVELSLEGGAHQKWVQCPNPAGNIGPASRTLTRTHARVHLL